MPILINTDTETNIFAIQIKMLYMRHDMAKHLFNKAKHLFRTKLDSVYS